MNQEEWKAQKEINRLVRERNIKERFDFVPLPAKEKVCHARDWATKTLTKHEGFGHHIEVTMQDENKDGTFTCSFAKSAWASDYSGSRQKTPALAIVYAVLEYIEDTSP